MVGRIWRTAFVLAWATMSCNVPEPPASSGGVDLPLGPCGRGIVVASSGSDFSSTNISLASFDGAPLSEVFLSSGALAAGASAALSGDVVLALSTPRSGKVVLIDRQNGTLTWADPATAGVVGQLSVGSNPQDYLEVAQDKAYVSRYTAGDLWIIDPRTAEQTGVIALAGKQDKRPFPTRMVASSDQVIAVLQMFASDYKTAADGRLVGIVFDEVAWTIEVPGLANCGGMDVSPSGGKLVLTCTGVFPGPSSSDAEQISHSGVVLFDILQSPPVEEVRFAVAAQLGQPVGWTVAFASEDVVIGRGVGDLQSGRRDTVFSLNVTSGEVRTLAESEPYALGDVRCTPRCGGVCLVADASLGALRRWTAGMVQMPPSKVDRVIGLPPRFVGGF